MNDAMPAVSDVAKVPFVLLAVMSTLAELLVVLRARVVVEAVAVPVVAEASSFIRYWVNYKERNTKKNYSRYTCCNGYIVRLSNMSIYTHRHLLIYIYIYDFPILYV